MTKYIATEPTCNIVNNTIMLRDSHGTPTNAMVHITSHNGQLRYDPIHVITCALTIIQACFANDEKLCVYSVGIKAGGETEEDGYKHVAKIGSVFRTCEVRGQPCWGLQSWEIAENFRWNVRQVGRWNTRHFEIEKVILCPSKNQGDLTAGLL